MDSFILIIAIIILLEVSYLTFNSLSTRKKVSKQAIICDTSALIDGRIATIAQAGFISGDLVIAKSVLRELQYMADNADHDKRERARYGLDIVHQLQNMPTVSVTILDDGETRPSEGVDERLITLSKQYHARLCTTDYNLNKVAQAEDIKVINVNELAHAIRSVHLPGEIIDVRVVSRGQAKEQGVGYLDDGTMVVIDGGKKYIDSTVTAEVTRMLQTEAGRMVFAKLLSAASKSPVDTPPAGKPSHSKRKAKRSAEDALVDLANTSS